MEKKALFAVVLSLLVLYFFQAYFSPPERPTSPQLETEEDLSPSEAEPFHLDKDALVLEKKGAASPPLSSVTIPEKEVRVETSLYTAVFTTRGAVLKSLILKKYLDQLGPNGRPVEMVTEKEARMLPLQVSLVGNESIEPLDIFFHVSRESLDLTDSKDEKQIIFNGTTADGIFVKKILTFSPESYVINIEIEVAKPSLLSSYKGTMISWIKKMDPDKDSSSRFGFTGPAAYVDGELNEVKIKSLDEGAKSFPQRVMWGGYEDKYFLAAFFLPNGDSMGVDIVKTKAGSIMINCFKEADSLQSADKSVCSYGFYCGPKDIEVLKSLGVGLEKAIDFGMFDVIAKPLLYALKYFNKVTSNYGFAIIILTIIIKIIFFPLTHKSYKSMKAMKDIQPQMMALKKKYKDDKERLNRETMDLYRTNKVNPLGGCLPLLIQFPIFIAFYWVLFGSIELRHAPFMLWIKDLSAYDPYYVTPILMGASMFIQQKMTPIAGDPAQAKVMLAMPIVFTFLFLKFPSGLVIYWLVNNVLQIFQQLYIDKRVS